MELLGQVGRLLCCSLSALDEILGVPILRREVELDQGQQGHCLQVLLPLIPKDPKRILRASKGLVAVLLTPQVRTDLRHRQEHLGLPQRVACVREASELLLGHLHGERALSPEAEAVQDQPQDVRLRGRVPLCTRSLQRLQGQLHGIFDVPPQEAALGNREERGRLPPHPCSAPIARDGAVQCSQAIAAGELEDEAGRWLRRLLELHRLHGRHGRR
mmetsp:Transcript_11602/g.36958  ORF Transcript_11602/g.36958 Transcript_11602/m.36958 type:complete len:216 (+) Transcript_11602:1950-2597(+)